MDVNKYNTDVLSYYKCSQYPWLYYNIPLFRAI